MAKEFDPMLKSPLTMNKPNGQTGPAVNNPPLMTPPDPLGYLPGGKKK